MKDFKKGIATCLVVANVICGTNAFAEDVKTAESKNDCVDVYHNKLETILKCKIDGKEFLVASKNHHMGGISIIQVK